MLLEALVHEHLENFTRNACDSKSVSKGAVIATGESFSGQNNHSGIDISSLQINEVTREEVGQMNRPTLDRQTLNRPTLDRPTLDRPAPNRSILVEVHTLEFRGEKYEDMSEGQRIDRFVFFLREMSSVVKMSEILDQIENPIGILLINDGAVDTTLLE